MLLHHQALYMHAVVAPYHAVFTTPYDTTFYR